MYRILRELGRAACLCRPSRAAKVTIITTSEAPPRAQCKKVAVGLSAIGSVEGGWAAATREQKPKAPFHDDVTGQTMARRCVWLKSRRPWAWWPLPYHSAVDGTRDGMLVR
ncbi:hypothetical protein H101_07853 [Trichophyton interdigitale H6]|nr:hypothetical protein H101_07853 [Trichophyton interdigitale H6]